MRDMKRAEIVDILLAIGAAKRKFKEAGTLEERNEAHASLITLYACLPVDQTIEHLLSIKGAA